MSQTTDEVRDKILGKVNDGREYRKFSQAIEARALGEDQEETYEVEGYATTFGEEYTLLDTKFAGTHYVFTESVDSRAFDECDMSDVIMQYDHQGRVFARLSNGTLSLTPDEHGLKVEARLGGTDIGRQLHQEIQGGYTTKMSFGFRVASDETTETTDHDSNTITVHRRITKISKLYDVSAVSLPANDGTEISARSYLDGVIEKLEEERLKQDKLRRAKEECLRLLSM